LTRTQKKTSKSAGKKPQLVHGFICHDLMLTLPREEVARTKILTRKKRVLPDGFDEAVRIFEEKLNALTEGAALTQETWGGKKNLKKQSDLKATAAVLLSFGVSRYPVTPEEEAAARALADPDGHAKNESEHGVEPVGI